MTTSATPDGQASPLVARTVALDVDTAANLLDLLPADRPVTWLRRGDGLIGWGVAAEIRTSGATRFSDAGKWWAETTTHAVVRNEVERARQRAGLLRLLRVRRRARQLGARRARDRHRSTR